MSKDYKEKVLDEKIDEIFKLEPNVVIPSVKWLKERIEMTRKLITQTHNKALEEAEKIIKEKGLHLGYKNNILEAIKAIKDKKI